MNVSLGVILGILIVMIIIMSTGVPIPFALGGSAILAIIFFWDPSGYLSIASGIWSTFTSDNFVSIPMFLLMANILQKSGIAEDLYSMLYQWLGGIRGGLAMGTVVICAIFAAMCGGGGPATITMGLIALPSMLKRGYDKYIAIGCIAAGGVLGIIIPPSIPMVVLAQYCKSVSVGKLFYAGMVPGILCVVIYCSYIAIRCKINPSLCPAVPKEERVSFKEKILLSKAILAPCIIIFGVLGSIWTGIATPSEAAGLGAFLSIIVSVAKRKLDWANFRLALRKTMRLVGMVLWILAGAQIFNYILNYVGIGKLLANFAEGLPGGGATMIIIMMLINFILGMLMDDFAVITLTAPLYIPLITALGINPLWFCMLFILNLQMAFLTPPYGFNLFYMKSVCPKDITLPMIYKAIIPFVGLQILALVICAMFPGLCTWLPNMMV